MNRGKSGGSIFTAFLAGCAIGATVSGTVVQAESAGSAADRAFIVEEVRKELRRLIDDESFMEGAIERGIESYIRKQRTQAEAEKNRVRTENASKMRPVSVERDHVMGDPDAPVSMVEYSDFECPYCKRFHPTAKQLLAQNAGKINWVYRHFPLAFHNPGAQKEAEASECAAELGGNEAFWRYSDLIYQRTTSNGKGFPIQNLVPLAAEIGLDAASFKECLDSGRMTGRVREDYEDGARAGVTGTPGMIFINHENGNIFAAAGALPLPRLQAAVDRLLQEQVVGKE
jgi:protein-disulfide isomerase